MPGLESDIVATALRQAELTPPERYFNAIPQELSGGQRQRVVIAGALALAPTFLVADEPVASLDASVRGEILALFLRLKHELGLGALVITHDLGLAWNIADRVLVMHEGVIVEQGTVEDVLLRPQHAYTKTLLSVVPTALDPVPGVS
jgi:peptide/nickel transport system ATP-binding protein